MYSWNPSDLLTLVYALLDTAHLAFSSVAQPRDVLGKRISWMVEHAIMHYMTFIGI